MRRTWRADEEECLLNHLELHKGSNGKWVKDSRKATKEVILLLEAIKPSTAISLTERNIKDKIRTLASQIPGRRMAKRQTIFLTGPAALKLRGRPNEVVGRTSRDITAGPSQAIVVCRPLLICWHNEKA
jgi:hypothetical protein